MVRRSVIVPEEALEKLTFETLVDMTEIRIDKSTEQRMMNLVDWGENAADNYRLEQGDPKPTHKLFLVVKSSF